MKEPIGDRIRAAQDALLAKAGAYTTSGDPEDWREVCRLKATLDALRRCAR